MLSLNISEAYNVLLPLGIFILEIAIYSVFVFKFYRFLASRVIIKINLSDYNNAFLRFFMWIFYILQNILAFPVTSLFWFAILAIFLGFLGKQHTSESVLFVSAALVSAVRVTAHYDEDLSRDLAKMLPFALLGIYIVDRSYFQVTVSLELLKGIPQYWRLMAYYFLFILALEFVLKIVYSIVSLLRGKQAHSSVSREPNKP